MAGDSGGCTQRRLGILLCFMHAPPMCALTNLLKMVIVLRVCMVIVMLVCVFWVVQVNKTRMIHYDYMLDIDKLKNS